MTRTKLATSHNGKYSLWLDADRYIYQFNEDTKQWQGYLCSVDAWERTFFVAGEAKYSECAAAMDMGARLKAQGWRIQIHPDGRDERGMATHWLMTGWAPDRASLEASRFTPHYQAVTV